MIHRYTCKLSIRARLRIFFLLPWLVILSFGFWQAGLYSQHVSQAQQASLSLTISLKIDDLVHELQNERGLTEGYLGRQKTDIASLLQQKLFSQRKVTDEQLRQFTHFIKKINFLNLEFQSLANASVINSVLQDAFASAEKLTNLRNEVDRGEFSEQLLSFNYYSEFIEQLLRLVSQVQVKLKDPEQARLSVDFINFLHLQEKAGQERGILNGMLNAKDISMAKLQQAVSYANLQNKLIADLFAISNSHHQQMLSAQLESKAYQQVLNIRKRVSNALFREKQLHFIEHEIGYGGLIHHFKNYILRGEAQYLGKFKQGFNTTRQAIYTLSQLSEVTEIEQRALTVLLDTLNLYSQQLIFAKELRDAGFTVEKIDEQVIINDDSAIAAIEQIQQANFNLTAEQWWQIASQRIAIFREIREHISHDMEALAIAEQNQATKTMLIYILLFTIAFTAGLYLSFAVVKRITSKIKRISYAMKQMQVDHQFNVPLEVIDRDEISDMAMAFNQMLAERKNFESELKISSAVFEYASEAIMVTNTRNEIETVNPAFTYISGYSAHEVIGKSPSLLNSGRHDEDFYQNMWQALAQHNCWQGEIWNKRKNGEVYPEYLSISVVRDHQNKAIQYISLFSDITKHKKYEEDIWLQANYDALTGLPNRNLCLERLHYELSPNNNESKQTALMFIDLDRFKNINDTWGHNSGDELLKIAAVRLSNCIRKSDTVARFGGDEFVVVLMGVTNKFTVEKIASNILETLSQPFYLPIASNQYNESTSNEAVISASVGITMAPQDGNDAEVLLKNADTAMYQAKAMGRNSYQFFTASMNDTVSARVHIEQHLRRAIKQNEFVLHYQPVVSLKSGKIIGAEALIRWQDPIKGMVYPDAFIDIAEDTGLIEPIGQWVIEQACKDLAYWHKIGLPLHVAVNVSSRQCTQTSKMSISNVINNALQQNNITANCLKVEITESLLMDNSEQMIATLQEIRNLGVAIHMDDFGTGYSSLSYLKHFPIDVLKIDRSFIDGAIVDKTDASLVEAVVLIGHSLQLKLVGEGIETKKHYDYLKRLSCDYGQGYYISRPVAADVFIEQCQKQSQSTETTA